MYNDGHERAWQGSASQMSTLLLRDTGLYSGRGSFQPDSNPWPACGSMSPSPFCGSTLTCFYSLESTLSSNLPGANKVSDSKCVYRLLIF